MKFNNYEVMINYLNYPKIINNLYSQNIKIINMYIKEKKLYLTISKTQLQKVKEILESNNIEYSIVQFIDRQKILTYLIGKIGIILGAIVICITLSIANMFTWKIDIKGNKTIAPIIITNVLHKHDIKIGSLYGDIKGAEEELRQNPKIVDCSIKKDGIVLVVNVFEKSDTSQINTEDTIPIVSKYDAQITNIILHSGTALIKVGDVVSKNKELIAPYVFSTTGEILKESTAEGNIFGDVLFNASEIISLKKHDFVRTGKAKSFTKLSLYGTNLGKQKKSPYKYYETVISSSYLSPLPIKVTTTTYYEQKLIEKKIDLDKAVEDTKNSILDRLVLKAGGSIKNYDTNLLQISANHYKLSIIIKANMEIGIKQSPSGL